MEASRGGAAAATWICRGGDAAAATWIYRGGANATPSQAKLIAEKLPAPADDCVIFICGPPPMYDALCGGRGEKEISGVLKEAGFASEQVYKF